MTAFTPATSMSSESLNHYQEQGYYVARGLFRPDEAAALRDAFMDQAREGPVEGLSNIPKGTPADDPLSFYPRMMHPHRHTDKRIGELSLRIMLDARIEAVARDLFGEEPIAAQSMFYFKPPGSRGQDLHQDNFFLRVYPGTCMAAWLAVDDADRGNGGMIVVPGSHRFEVECPESRDDLLAHSISNRRVEPPHGYEEVGVDMAAGDMLFFNGSVIHGSYPNTSEDRFRRAIIFHYMPNSGWEINKNYHPLLNFAGEVVSRDKANRGGPCGG